MYIYIDEQHYRFGEYSDEHVTVSTMPTPPVDYMSCRHVSVAPTELKMRHTVLLADVCTSLLL